MSQFIGLPEMYGPPGRERVVHSCGLSPELIRMTAHVTGGEPQPCHKCGQRVRTFVVKPGSPHVWCLGCWQ